MNSNYKKRYTWNTLKRKVSNMTTEQKEEFLKELQATYMTERTKAQKQLQEKDIRLLRRQIAFMKTVLHQPGYHYHPRGE